MLADGGSGLSHSGAERDVTAAAPQTTPFDPDRGEPSGRCRRQRLRSATRGRSYAHRSIGDDGVPGRSERGNALQRRSLEPCREPVGASADEGAAFAVGLEPEHDPQQEHRRGGRPRLRPARGRVGHRERRRRAGQAGEYLGQRVAELARCIEQRPRDPSGLTVPAVAREAPGDQRVVVRPDRAVVVRERPVAGVVA